MNKLEEELQAPFPYFGSKRYIARLVWRRFGRVRNYVEPFCGSLAVLLARPKPIIGCETVNDINAWLINFWRSLRRDPDAVAKWADWLATELDLHARGDWLFYRPDVGEWIERIRSDPDYYDVKSAGWWLWGQCIAVRGGWQLWPNASRVRRSRVHLGTRLGIFRTPCRTHADIRRWMRALAARLRHVRVCCGNWTRVCVPFATVQHGLTAVFLDPPYGISERAACYGANDDRDLSAEVREWAIEWGSHSLMRIALCGHEGEHDMPDGWTVHAWRGPRGFACADNPNRCRERVWFSPHCLPESKQRSLLADAESEQHGLLADAENNE